MKETLPLVSIVTPSLNQGKFIEDTVLSVKNQDYPNIEHIIVDGGSTDNTLEILERYEGTYNMRWISEPDEGTIDAINKGFEMARGEILAWLNSDDVYFTKDVISYVVQQFKTHQDADVIYGDDVSIDANNYIFSVRISPDWNYEKILRGFVISQPATFFRREVILQNLLNVRKPWYVFDFELWLKIGKSYKFLHVNKILAGNRIYKGRGMILYAEESKKISKELMRKYGQKFGLTYYLMRYFVDLPQLQSRKFLGLKSLLTLRKNSNDLAFRGRFRSGLTLVFTQILPLALLMRLDLI